MHKSNEQIYESIQQFTPLTCWKVGLHYGSMIYLEMKDRIKQKMLDGSEEDVGSCHLSILADNWKILHEKKEIKNSNDITRQNAENELNERFTGEKLLDIAFYSEKMLLISFSSDLLIAIGVNGQKKDSDDFFNIFFPDGAVFAANKSSGFYKAQQTEKRI